MTNSPGIQPSLEPERVRGLLQACFSEPILNLQVVQGGHVAQTFSFAVGAQEYVVRFNAKMLVNFEKEAYAYEHFASPRIPIPRIVQVGRLGDVHYAISEKLPGVTLLQVPWTEFLALIPQQLETLDAIHAIRVDDQPGYGIFDGRGRGLSSRWHQYLNSVNEEEDPADFYGRWHTLFGEGILERDLFERVYKRLRQLVPYCPEERWLVHGGFGFNNVLVQDGKLTAVLDWMDAAYGDFLFDVAYMDFWLPDDPLRERFRTHYEQQGTAIPFYAERVLCYQCYVALHALRFNAKGRDQSGYDWVRSRILSLAS